MHSWHGLIIVRPKLNLFWQHGRFHAVNARLQHEYINNKWIESLSSSSRITRSINNERQKKIRESQSELYTGSGDKIIALYGFLVNRQYNEQQHVFNVLRMILAIHSAFYSFIYLSVYSSIYSFTNKTCKWRESKWVVKPEGERLRVESVLRRYLRYKQQSL